VPVVSEDPRPYYPTTDYSSEEGSWSDISTTTPYQERNIYKTAHPEGAYRELAGDKVFIFTYIPGLRDPIRAYKPHRHCLNHYSNNPNYQASLYKPYYHRVLTAAEQRAFEEEAPKIVQTYNKPKEEDLAPISLVSSERFATEISEIKFCQFDKPFTTATPEHIHLSCHKYQDNILHEQKSDVLMHPCTKGNLQNPRPQLLTSVSTSVMMN
jgi:hypothetical protein